MGPTTYKSNCYRKRLIPEYHQELRQSGLSRGFRMSKQEMPESGTFELRLNPMEGGKSRELEDAEVRSSAD